jgi:hypothetical protein
MLYLHLIHCKFHDKIIILSYPEVWSHRPNNTTTPTNHDINNQIQNYEYSGCSNQLFNKIFKICSNI